ncbi:MAG TPA: hypothetical protein VEN82_09000, partial [Actinomycetota bacterium]|nr:hypothetical protein [Actinomycetota bacterium]
AVGYTEDYVSQHGELYVVRTDASGAVPGCGDVSPAPALTPIDPGLVPIPATLPVGVGVASGAAAPVTTMPTSVLDQHECG